MKFQEFRLEADEKPCSSRIELAYVRFIQIDRSSNGIWVYYRKSMDWRLKITYCDYLNYNIPTHTSFTVRGVWTLHLFHPLHPLHLNFVFFRMKSLSWTDSFCLIWVVGIFFRPHPLMNNITVPTLFVKDAWKNVQILSKTFWEFFWVCPKRPPRCTHASTIF